MITDKFTVETLCMLDSCLLDISRNYFSEVYKLIDHLFYIYISSKSDL
jgi:hypothetical protein